MKKKLPTPAPMKQSNFKAPTAPILQLSAGAPTGRTAAGQPYKPSAGAISVDASTPYTTPMPPMSPNIRDVDEQNAAILRAAANQLLSAGFMRKVRSRKSNEVKLCMSLDLWTEDLKLR